MKLTKLYEDLFRSFIVQKSSLINIFPSVVEMGCIENETAIFANKTLEGARFLLILKTLQGKDWTLGLFYTQIDVELFTTVLRCSS